MERYERTRATVLTREVAGWAQHVAARNNVPIGVVMHSGKKALERDIALALVDAADSVARRALADKETPEGSDLLHQLARRMYDRLYAIDLAKKKREQKAQMQELREQLKAQQGNQ